MWPHQVHGGLIWASSRTASPAKLTTLATVSVEKDGTIVVERIRDGSNAALAGLQLNDVVRATTARAKVGCPEFDCLAGGHANHKAFAEPISIVVI